MKNVCKKLSFILALGLSSCLYFSCSDDSNSSNAKGATEDSFVTADTSLNEQNSRDSATSLSGKSCSTEGAFRFASANSHEYCENGIWVEYADTAHTPGFNPCNFNFGAAWQNSHEEEAYYKGLDYIAVWLGDNDFYNAFEARMVEMCVAIHATPMIYGYVIAEFGKDNGLEDCDVASSDETSLCVHGANLIREYFSDSILFRYREYAEGMRIQLEDKLEINPDTFESIWLIEPDFYQYSESGSMQNNVQQLNGGVVDSMMGVYFSQIVNTIKTYLPSAKIAIDISPWVLDQKAWYSNFDLSLVDYASTSGGRTAAGSEKVRAGNIATWASIAEITGKPVLADAGYDAGGKGTGHAKIWDNVDNIKARIADGVIGVMQMDAALDYPERADTIRLQLEKTPIPWCNE